MNNKRQQQMINNNKQQQQTTMMNNNEQQTIRKRYHVPERVSNDGYEMGAVTKTMNLCFDERID